MTVWAGYYARHRQSVSDGPTTDALARVLSRFPSDVPRVLRSDGATLVWIETGAFADSSVVTERESFTLVAGEPLLSGSSAGNRRADIRRLHEAWSRGDFPVTAESVGTFAAVHYDAARGILSLVADKLGVRPIYYAVTDHAVYFASALRILEALPDLRKVMDVRGAVETLALGYPLADRTPYRDVFTIRNGEIVTFEGPAVRRSYYWNLSTIPEDRITLDEAAERMHALFSRAIDRRLGGDRTSVAFLSGGLDSRCMVAELVARSVKLHTFNFADEGTKDQVLGDAFAAVVETRHTRIPRPADPVRWSNTMASVWGASSHRSALPVERAGLVWSGDGGSVGLGFVGVYASVIALLRAGKRDEAVTKYFQEHEITVPIRVFRGDIGPDLRDLVHTGVREALDEVRCESDPGRELYAFRMAHDQRRHLTLHFEDVDLHRLEFHLPFYDADLIAAVAATPTDFAVGHRLYHEALRFFPDTIKRVAWQTYPGHEPCPVPLPSQLIDQWGDQQKDIVRRSRRAGILGETLRVLFSGSFPRPLLDRRYLIAASCAHWLGIGDYAYALDYAKSFSDMWGVSRGRWAMANDDAARG